MSLLVIANPKSLAGVVSHDFTCAVTSTTTNCFAITAVGLDKSESSKSSAVEVQAR